MAVAGDFVDKKIYYLFIIIKKKKKIFLYEIKSERKQKQESS